MTLTTLLCNVTDGQNGINGYIQYTLNQAIIDSGTLAVPTPTKVTLTNGLATFALEPTDINHTSYNFEVHSVVSTVDTLLYSFTAIVPTSSVAINFSDLANTTGLATDLQDTSYLSVTRLLYNSEDFWRRLRTEVFVPSGAYSSTTYYQRGDVVSYNGSSYLCVSPTAVTGISPTNTTTWQLLASIGATGTGTSGNDTAYDATSWDGQLDAPTRNAVRDIIETLARSSQLSTLAPLNNPAFTGSMTLNSLAIATQSYVAGLYAPLNNAALTGTPSSTTPIAGDISNKIATTSFINTALANYVLSSAFGLTFASGQISCKLPNLIIKAGTTVTTTDGSGNMTITYNASFPSTLYVVIVCNGDISGSTVNPAVVASSLSLSSFTARANGVASTSYRLNWLALGV